MKQTLYIIAVMLFAFAGTASATENCGNDWREKMLSEKVAFITVEVGLTPEEAQTFWPVYNEINKKGHETMHKVFTAYKALEDAVNAEKSSKEISKLLDSYLEALEIQRENDSKSAEKYRKVLPEDKVAKLYVAEEKFRRQHIRKMKSKPQGNK